MGWQRLHRLTYSIEIDASVQRVFTHWTRYEDFPRVMRSVRHTKRIDRQRVLWDADIAGRQVVWEAQVLESIPNKRIRWESLSGAANSGHVWFDALPEDRTRLTVEIEYQTQGFLEDLGARLSLVDLHVRRDLSRFRRFVESEEREEEIA